jgi:hypothetical protein
MTYEQQGASWAATSIAVTSLRSYTAVNANIMINLSYRTPIIEQVYYSLESLLTYTIPFAKGRLRILFRFHNQKIEAVKSAPYSPLIKALTHAQQLLQKIYLRKIKKVSSSCTLR